MSVITDRDPDDASRILIVGYSIRHDIASRLGNLVTKGLTNHILCENPLRKLEADVSIGNINRFCIRVSFTIYRYGLESIFREISFAIGGFIRICLSRAKCFDGELKVSILQRVATIGYSQDFGSLYRRCGCICIVGICKGDGVIVGSDHGTTRPLIDLNHRIAGVLKVALSCDVFNLVSRRQTQRAVSVIDNNDVHPIYCCIIINTSGILRCIVIISVVVDFLNDITVFTRLFESDLSELK